MMGTADLPKLAGLRRVRHEAFLSQRELAAKSGVGAATIARLEAGQINARFATVRKLAEALGVPPAQLVAESPNNA